MSKEGMPAIIVRAGRCGHHFDNNCDSCRRADEWTNQELDNLRAALREQTPSEEMVERARAEALEEAAAHFDEEAKRWERLSRKSAERGAEYADITHSQASMSAGYSDHAGVLRVLAQKDAS